MIIKLEHDGRSWAWDDDSLTVLQGVAVEEHIKGDLVDYEEGLARHRSACYQALGWLIFHEGRLSGDGRPEPPIASVDFPITKLSGAWLKARLAVIAEMEAAVEGLDAGAAGAPEAAPGAARAPGPTGPGSAGPSGSTSGRSPRSSGTGRATSTGSASASSTA